MYFTEHKIIRIGDAEFLENYSDRERIIGYCRECGNYGNVWVCPPYGFETVRRLTGFKHVFIIGTRIRIDTGDRSVPKDAESIKAVTYHIMEEARREIDERLLDLEKKYPESLAFFAGSCFLCRTEDCTRRTGKPCLHPDKARSSLEAYGFDISKTASDLLDIEIEWSENYVLPEYFTLVSGFFTKHEIEDIKW